MKLHYSIHVLMLAAIVYLAAQLSSSNQNNVDVTDNQIPEITDIKVDDSELKTLKDQIEKLNKEKHFLEKAKDVADDKIKGLNKEIDGLIAENNELKNRKLVQEADPIKNIREMLNKTKLNPKKNFARFYGPLFDQLNLSEEEQKEFIELLTGSNGTSKMIMINGVPLSGNNGNISDELKNFLGDDLPAYEKYKETAMARGQINSMNNNLKDEDKLSHDESEALIDLLHERRLEKAKGNTISDDEYLEQSAGFLNDNQKKAFKKQLRSPITVINSSSITIR